MKVESILIMAVLALVLNFTSSNFCYGVDTATVVGNVGFVDPSPEIVSWLTSVNQNQTQVVLRATTGTAMVSGTATPVSPPPDLATFSLDIPATSTTNVTGTASLLWSRASNPVEKFGYNIGSGPTSTISSEFPECSAPANETSTCHLREHACLMNMTIRLIGPDVSELAEGGSTNPDAYIPCKIQVSAGEEDQAWGGPFIFTRSQLEIGEIISLPVREGVPLKVTVSCSALPDDEDFGFSLDDDDRVPLLLQTTGTCGDINCDIEVEAKSGLLRGYFDLVGESEALAEVQIKTPNRSVTPTTADASSILSPEDYWEIPDAPANAALTVFARALLEGNNQAVELPHLTDANGSVSIEDGQITNIGSRLITATERLYGRVYLYDPAGFNDLTTLQTGSFSELRDYNKSYTLALGNSNTVPGGASGINGKARGAWNGNVADDGKSATFDYSLVLTGLSPHEGALDGTDTLAVPWDVKTISARFLAPERFAYFDAYLKVDNHYVLEPSQNSTVDDIHLCLSSYELNMALDSASNKEMAFPFISLSEQNVESYPSLDFPQTEVWAHGGGKRYTLLLG